MRKLIVFLLFACCATFGQQTNSDIIPATPGLNLGRSNQRWNGYFQNLDINGTCTVNGFPCLGAGSGGNGITITNAAGLATVPGKQNGTIAVITDGLTANDCTVGGGITNVACQFNGTTWSQLPASSSANFASPPPLGNTTPNTVAGTVVNIVGSGLFFSAQPTCLFGESDNTLDEFEDVAGIPMWLPQGALGPCSQFLTYTPLPVGVTPTDKQVPAWDAATGAFTIQPQTGGNPAFSALTSATNTTAAMVVGTGASLGTAGSGTITANALASGAVAGTSPIAVSTSGGVSTVSCANCQTNLGPVFNLRNYGCVADDVTDNATCFTNWAAAINAYVGPGIPTGTCDIGPGDKAYLTTGPAAFSIPVTIRGNCTIDAKSTMTGPVLQLGPTGLLNFSTAQIPPYTVDGLTFVGGSGGATAIEIEKYISESRITRIQFHNFGSAASTSWAINTNGGQNNEIHVIDNLWWADDSTSGRNGFRFVDTTGNSETLEIIGNSLNDAQPPTFASPPCGGEALHMQGNHITTIDNDFFGFATSIRIGNTTSPGNQDILIWGGAIDSAGCANGSVKSGIQFGDAGNIANTFGGPVHIMGVRLTHRAGMTLFDIAGDNTSGAALANIVQAESNARIGGSGPITSVASYALSGNNTGFTDTALSTSLHLPIWIRKGSAPSTPPSGAVSFWANSSGTDRGLAHVDDGGFSMYYLFGPAIQTGATPGTAIAAQTCQDTNVTVTNSFAAGQAVVATPSGALGANWANIIWNAYISANNTVTLHLCNPTAGSLTPAAQTFYIRVLQ